MNYLVMVDNKTLEEVLLAHDVTDEYCEKYFQLVSPVGCSIQKRMCESYEDIAHLKRDYHNNIDMEADFDEDYEIIIESDGYNEDRRKKKVEVPEVVEVVEKPKKVKKVEKTESVFPGFEILNQSKTTKTALNRLPEFVANHFSTIHKVEFINKRVANVFRTEKDEEPIQIRYNDGSVPPKKYPEAPAHDWHIISE